MSQNAPVKAGSSLPGAATPEGLLATASEAKSPSLTHEEREALLIRAHDSKDRGEYLLSIAQAAAVFDAQGASPSQRAEANLLRALNAANRGLPAEGVAWADQSILEGTAAAEFALVAQSLVTKGQCHAVLEQVDEALAALRGAVALVRPEMPIKVRRAIHTGMALSYRALGLSSMAIESCRAALRLVPQDAPPALWVRAWANLANAIGDWCQTLAPSDPAAAVLLDEVLARRAELLEAAGASGSRRSRITVFVTTSRLLLAAGRVAEARQALREALAMAPEIGWEYRRDWWIDLALAERALGDEAAARHAIAQARLLIDANPGVRLGIHSVRRMAELATLEGDAVQAWRWAREYHARVVRSEHAALESRVVELAVSVQQKVLPFEVADLRKERADLKDSYRQMHELASKDPLTGLLNRRAMQAEFESRPHGRLYLGMFDVDHFKRVNDLFGHPLGDLVLKQVAGIMGASLRQHDLLGRYGGEEFVVMLTDVGEQGCVAAVKRVREGLAQQGWAALAAGLTVTLSGGLVAVHQGESFDAAVARADVLLYQAKAAGRDCVLMDHGGSAH